MFRPVLDAALARSDRVKDGRPPYDTVLMFRMLVLQALYGLSDEQAEFQLRGRLSFMRFAGLELHDPVPDAKTIWLYREQLERAGAIDTVFAASMPCSRALSRRPDRLPSPPSSSVSCYNDPVRIIRE